MLTPARRPLLASEREQLEKDAMRTSHDGCAIAAWYVVPAILLGAIVGLIPVVGASPNIGQGLLWAGATVAIWCTGVRVTGWLLFRRAENAEARRLLAADLAGAEVEVFDVRVEKVWRVWDLDEDGAVYVLRTVEGALAFLYASDAIEPMRDADCVPAELRLERLTGSHRLLSIKGSGEPLPAEKVGIPFEDLGIEFDWNAEFVLIDSAGLKGKAKALLK